MAVGDDPERPAVVDRLRTWTWGEVERRILARIGHLRRRQFSTGDRLGVLLPNGADFFEWTFAAAGAGAVLVPLNGRLVPEEMNSILRDAEVRLLVTDDAAFPSVRPALADLGFVASEPNQEPLGPPGEPDPGRLEDVLQLYYTSGTTGRPKGVMLTASNVATHAENAVSELGLTADDTWAHVAPMFHLADAWATLAVTRVGGRHVMLPRFEAQAALDLLVDQRVTITNLVPTMLNLMVKHPSAVGRSFPHLRRIMSGGAPIAPELVRRIVLLFQCDYVQTYGMTETSPYLTLSLLPPELLALDPDQQLVWKSRTGRPFRSVELRVVTESGQEVPADGRSVGEILVRGPTVTPGYWRRPDETEAAFSDGWLRTGDLAVRYDHGFIDIVDRKKDVIVTGGENVYSTEVEAVLYRCPGVLEAAVFGVPDEVWGEAVCAAIVRGPDGGGLDSRTIDAHCRLHLAGFKIPKRVLFLPELPKTGSGKIAKRQLRASAV